MSSHCAQLLSMCVLHGVYCCPIHVYGLTGVMVLASQKHDHVLSNVFNVRESGIAFLTSNYAHSCIDIVATCSMERVSCTEPFTV